MQRLQFSVSWLQTTEMSFTSVLETPLNDILHPLPIIPSPLIINFWKSFQPPSHNYSKPPDYSVLYSRII